MLEPKLHWLCPWARHTLSKAKFHVDPLGKVEQNQKKNQKLKSLACSSADSSPAVLLV